MRDILKNKIEYIQKQKEIFKTKFLPEFRKQTVFDKAISKEELKEKLSILSGEEFQQKLNILKNLTEKENFYKKRLDHLEKLISIENSISYLKEAINNNINICFLSFNTEKESIRVLTVYYKNTFSSEVILEETYEDSSSLQEILNKDNTRFICFDKLNLFNLLEKKGLSYDKNLFSCVQRMSLFFYNDLSTLYKLDKIYEDLGLEKSNTDNSVTKIKKIFDGLINS